VGRRRVERRHLPRCGGRAPLVEEDAFLDAQIAQQEVAEIALLEDKMAQLEDELAWHEEATAALVALREEVQLKYSLLVSDQLTLPPDTPVSSLTPSRMPSELTSFNPEFARS